MLLMVENGIRVGICHAIYGYFANNKYMKGYDKSKESSQLNYWDVNKLYGWAMSLKLPLAGFKWVEDASELRKDFIENYNKDSDKEYFLEVDF